MDALRQGAGYRGGMTTLNRRRRRPLLKKLIQSTANAGIILALGGLALAWAAPSVPLRGQGYDILIDPSAHLEDSEAARKLMDLSLFTLIGADDEAVNGSQKLREIRGLLEEGAEFQCSRESLNAFIRADAYDNKWTNVLRAVTAASGADYPSRIEEELRNLAMGDPPDLERLGSLQANALSFYTTAADPLLDAGSAHQLRENIKVLHEEMMFCSGPY